jgi:ribosome-associated translation inhibitor RaiA
MIRGTKVHVDGHNVVCRRTGPDMYEAITQASQHMRELIFKERHKKFETKRNSHEA